MIKPVITVRSDTGKLRDLVKRLGHSDKSAVSIGVHEDAGQYKNGQSVASVALSNEFGVGVPERSFLRSAVNGNLGKINKWREEAVSGMLTKGWSMEKALTYIGFRVQTLVQNKIKSGVPPPNAPATVAKKQRAGVAPRTLIETTLLLRSIAYRILLHDPGSDA